MIGHMLELSIVVVASLLLQVRQDKPAPSVTKALTDVARTTTDEGDPLFSLTVNVIIEPQQTGESGGLEFVVEIDNDGNDPIEIRDPASGPQLYVSLSTARELVSLPPQRSSIVCSRRPLSEGGGTVHRVALSGPRPFELVERVLRTRSGVSRTLNDSTDEFVRLEPGARYSITGRFTEALQYPKDYRKALRERYVREASQPEQRDRAGDQGAATLPQPRTVPIPPGEYEFSAFLDLQPKSPDRPSRSLAAEQIKIRFGPNPTHP